MLNFENLKSGFRDYLENYSKEHPWKKFNLDGENKSIFMYSKEFKDYLVNELNCDASIYSQSMSEIMSMQIVDGKLVAGNSQGSKEQGETLKALEEASLEEENALIESSEELSTEADENDLITEVMNDLMQDKTFKKALDTDGDGEIGDEELAAFYETIKSQDEDETNVSLDDIINAAQDIKDGKFEIKVQDSQQFPEDIAAANKAAGVGGGGSAGGASGAGSSGGASGGGGSAGGTPSASQGASAENLQKSLQNMTVPELQQELMTSANELGEKQNALSEVQTESNSTLQEAQGLVDSYYQAYEDAVREVDEELADRIKEAKENVDAKQEAVNSKEAEISSQESTVSACETAYTNAQNTVTQLQARLSELQQQDEDGSMAESISALQGEIQTAQAAEEEAKAALEEAKAQLETLKGEKETLDGELTEAQTALSDVQAEVPEGNEKIESAQADWDEAKQGFSELKDQMLATAQTDVDNAINRVNEVQTALSEAQRQQTLAQYTNYNAQAGERLANQAHTVAGTVGYCMGGVCDTLQRTYGCSMYGLGSAYMAADALRGNTPGYEEIASHFTEVEVPRDELASLPAGYIVVWDNNQNGGGSNVSSAGRVHGHISISLGDGRESSDHIQNQITNRDANYTVFAPIS